MPITRLRTSPPSGPRSVAASLGAMAATAKSAPRTAARRLRLKTRAWVMATPFGLLATPFDAAVEGVDIVLRQAGGVDDPHRLGLALADHRNRNGEAVLAQELRHSGRAVLREFEIVLGRAAHVGMAN